MKKYIFILIILCFSCLVTAQDGSLDSTFNPNDRGFGSGDKNGCVYSTEIQNDGKILLAGSFTFYNGNACRSILRLNADGSFDESFNSNSLSTNYSYNLVTIQANQKILIAQKSIAYGNITNIIRLNTDGSIDTTFTLSSAVSVIYSIAIQADGKILIGGERLIRLNTDGSIDATFTQISLNGISKSVVSQPDGKIIIAQSNVIVNGSNTCTLSRINTDGSVDTSFQNNIVGYVSGVVTQNNGKIIVIGDFSVNGINVAIVRLNEDGSRDMDFNTGAGGFLNINLCKVQNDDKIIIVQNSSIKRLNSDGSLDSSFISYNKPYFNISSISLQQDDKIIIGSFSSLFIRCYFAYETGINRLNSDGSIDLDFNPQSGAQNLISKLVTQSDGKVIINGSFTSYNGVHKIFIARINPDGSLDNTFQYNVPYSENGDADYRDNPLVKMALQDDDKLILIFKQTSNSNSKIVRLNIDGTIDTTFIQPNVNYLIGGTFYYNPPKSIIIQQEGIILGGYFTSYNGIPVNKLIRLNSDGSLDTSFNPSSSGINSGLNQGVEAIVEREDGRLVIGGKFTFYNDARSHGIVFLNPDGDVNTAFHGIPEGYYVDQIIEQPDQKVIFRGNFPFYGYVGIGINQIIRLNADETLDTTFNPDAGITSFKIVAIQADGRLIIAATNYNNSYYQGILINGIARLNLDGSLDTTFQTGTSNGLVNTAVIQPDGNIIIGGSFTSYNGVGRNRIAKVIANNNTLGVNTNSYLENSVFVYKDKSALHIKSKKDKIHNVQLYDITGRLVYENKKVDSLELTIEDLKIHDQILIVKITNENNNIVTKKIVY
jgi:uncharacterized delta-60 repeat protein